jgi:3,5-epimerase/4-reductase
VSPRTLVFGGGWLGTWWVARMPGAILSTADIADPEAVEAALDAADPDRVVNAAGKTGRPNVDQLEGMPEVTRRSNVTGPLVLAAACRRRGLHFTHLSSGCMYTGSPPGGFEEEDPPNFSGSVYARSKAEAEAALRAFDALQLRLRLPLSEVPHPRNLLTKLLGYPRIVRVANSITVLEDFERAAFGLVEGEAEGVWNVVNDGVEFHDELLALYRDRVQPGLAFEVVPEPALGLRAGRSNCVLSTRKLHAAGLALPPLATRLPELVDRYAARVQGRAERPAGRSPA